MAKHTNMPSRKQRTPHGDVALTSRWMRDHYLLVASGSLKALRWLFPKVQEAPERHGAGYRHAFMPALTKVTVERDLRRICSRWSDSWDTRYEDEAQDFDGTGTTTDTTPAISTLGMLFDHLHEQRTGTVARSTSDRDRYRLQLWRDELGEETLLTALTEKGITAALARIGKRTSPPTANPALGVLKTYLNWAANLNLLTDQSHRNVKPLKEPANARHHRAWWTAAEVEFALIHAAKDSHQPTATLLVACGCYLGLRPEEIIMLRWEDLSLDDTDPKTGVARPVCHVTPHDGWQPKDGEARDIPICTPLLAIFIKHRQAKGYLLQAEPGRPGRPRGGKGWIYRYDPKACWARIMKAVVAAGGRRITMYGMRHSFASNFLIAGVSDVKVSRWLGHADTRMVHRHYGHLLSYDGDINAVVAKRLGSA